MSRDHFVEQDVVDNIVYFLEYNNRYFVNVHGSSFSRHGTPDIIILDKDNRFLAIEAKVAKRQPKADQLNNAPDILRSGGRWIVAYEDFDLDKIDNHTVKTLEVEDTDDLNKIELQKYKFYGTTEMILV